MVLTPTDPSIPEDVEVPKDLPDYAVKAIGDQIDITNAALRSLRLGNTSQTPLDGVRLPPGAMFYPRKLFEQENDSPERFKAMVARLGGIEPLVLAVSRPAFLNGHAVVIEHVYSTWSGCGGVDLFEVDNNQNGWKPSLLDVLVIW